jgi:hypothetical protein
MTTWLEKGKNLGLIGEEGVIWNAYIGSLQRSHLGITKEEDRIIWLKNQTLGHYSARLRHQSKFSLEEGNRAW